METFKGDLDKKETYYLNEDDKLIVISKWIIIFSKIVIIIK
jgi:hypothetical protein